MQALTWITCAQKMLTIGQLQHALATELGEDELDPDNISPVEQIISACAGLLIFDEQSQHIRLVHYTTEEYLERTRHVWFPDADEDMALTCVKYLSWREFRQTGPCATLPDYKERLTRYSLYKYAAKFWIAHASKAKTTHLEILRFLELEHLLIASAQSVYSFSYGYVEPKNLGLKMAVQFESTDALEYLLAKYCADVRAGPEPNDPLLLYAAAAGNIETVRVLLREGADISVQDERGDRVLCRAAESNHIDIMQLLLDSGADVKASTSPLRMAVSHSNLAMVRLLLERGAETNAEGYNGPMTVLHAAVRFGNLGIIRLLLEKAAKLEGRDDRGQTSLCVAAGTDSVDISVLQLLLEKGAVIDALDFSNRTPLAEAASVGAVEKVRLLAERGADLEAQDSNNNTALTIAMAAVTSSSRDTQDRMGEYLDVIRVLLQKGATFKCVDLWRSRRGPLLPRKGVKGPPEQQSVEPHLEGLAYLQLEGREPAFWGRGSGQKGLNQGDRSWYGV